MNILIIGSGGREHALAWKAAQSPKVQHVYVAPGNAGTASEPGMTNLAISELDFARLAETCLEHQIELTIVGPEAPLVAGIVDYFREKNLKCFGPSKGAAQLEGSKAFTKDFLARHNIPSAFYQVFIDPGEAKNYVSEKGTPIVIKADGLAAGKGVIIAMSEQEAFDAIDDMLVSNRFGDAGARVVVEEFLKGEEASFIVMVDGDHILPMASSQDHKARDNGDLGPNTGGMGAYSPAPVVTTVIHQRIMDEVIWPTVRGMKAEGNTFTGFLYAGIMVADDGTPNVLEFNVRFGDPETQPIMMRLQSDLADLCLAAIDGNLDQTSALWDSRAAVGVVMASPGYPDAYPKGELINSIPLESSDSKVFHAGTQLDNDQIRTNGGRVLCVVGLGADVKTAQQVAYSELEKVDWPTAYYRTDIGFKAINR